MSEVGAYVAALPAGLRLTMRFTSSRTLDRTDKKWVRIAMEAGDLIVLPVG